MEDAGSSAHGFQFVGIHFDGGVLVDHGNGQYEAEAISLLDQGSFEALHGPAPDSNAFADDQVKPGLNVVFERLRSEDFYLAVGNREYGATVADNAHRSGRAKDRASLLVVDPDKEIGRKQRALCFDALAILPDSLNLVGRQERFNLPDIEHAADGVLVLGHRVKSEPARDPFRGGGGGRLQSGYVRRDWVL